MEPLDVLDRAAQSTVARVAALGPDDWARPTPCTDWSVRALVGHLVNGARISPVLLAGRPAEETRALILDDPLGDDPLATLTGAVEAERAAFRSPGALDGIVHHVIGDIPATRLLEFRTTDYALHGWDLARAVGADETIDADVAAAAWAATAPMKEFISQTGVFGAGPSGTVDDSAPLTVRLLDLTGRRPRG